MSHFVASQTTVNLPFSFSFMFSAEDEWSAAPLPVLHTIGDVSDEDGGVGSTDDGDTGGWVSKEPSWWGERGGIVPCKSWGSPGGDNGNECMTDASGESWTWSADKLCCRSVIFGICFVLSLLCGSYKNNKQK